MQLETNTVYPQKMVETIILISWMVMNCHSSAFYQNSGGKNTYYFNCGVHITSGIVLYGRDRLRVGGANVQSNILEKQW